MELLILFLVILIVFLVCFKESFGGGNSLLNIIYNENKANFIKYNVGKEKYGADCIYCISMPDRKNYMINKLQNVEFTLVDAITPQKLKESYYKKLTGHEQFITKRTRLPVQLSFTMCYLDAIKKGYSTIIIFEDDLVINTTADAITNGVEEFKKSSFDVFYMGYCELKCDQNFKAEGELVNVPDYSNLWCCHSICYKVKYLPKIIKKLYPMDDEFDIKLTKIFKKLGYDVCIPKTVYFDQNKNLGTNNETFNPDGSLLLSPPTCVIE